MSESTERDREDRSSDVPADNNKDPNDAPPPGNINFSSRDGNVYDKEIDEDVGGEEDRPPPIPDTVLQDSVKNWDKEDPAEDDGLFPSEDSKETYTCPDPIRGMLKSAIDTEVNRAVKSALDTRNALYKKSLADLNDDFEEKLADEISRSNVQHQTEIEKLRNEYETKIKMIKHEKKIALSELKQDLTAKHDVILATKTADLQSEFSEKLNAAEERVLFQKEKAIRRMAERCDLQIKSIRDWAEKDKTEALASLNTSWAKEVRMRRAHVESEQASNMSLFQEKCQEEVDEIAASRDKALHRVKILEKQLLRTYKVLRETAASRSMARADAPLSLKRFLRTHDPDDLLDRPPPIPIASPFKSPTSVAPTSGDFRKTKCQKRAAMTSPLDEKLLSDLGYSDPTSLVDTTTPETRHALVTPENFFKTRRPLYLGGITNAT